MNGSSRPAAGAIRVAGLFLCLISLIPAVAIADILSDNLANEATGTENASDLRWLAASFGTDSSEHTLSSVTLLLGNSIPGTAQLDLYTDLGLEPGTPIGTLTPPAEFSESPAPTKFTADGFSLSANTTYWVVLRAESGQFDWAWTADNSGNGPGFQYTWASSDEEGTFWYSFDIYPTQMLVEVDVPARDKPADMNCDDKVDFGDIDPFVLALTGRAEYEESYPECRWLNGDVNESGAVDFADIDGFVECLTGGGCP